MRKSRSSAGFIALGALIGFFPGLSRTQCANAQTYSVTDLGWNASGPGGGTEASFINSQEQVVGNDSKGNGYFYQNGATTNIGSLGEGGVVVSGLNNQGQVVGRSTTSGGSTHAFLYSLGAGMTDLGTLPGGSDSQASAINNEGQVVGYSTVNGFAQAFLYTGGTMTDLGAIVGGTSSVAYAINDSGQVVGHFATASGPTHAYVYSQGSVVDIGQIINGGITSSDAFGINSNGEVVGSFINAPDGFEHAFLYNNGTVTDIGALLSSFANTSYGQQVNADGQVGGSFVYANDGLGGVFLYDPALGVTNIGSLFGGFGMIFNALNDYGQIAGEGSSNSACCIPYIYSEGQLTNLASALPYGNGQVLGLNDAGEMVAWDGDAYLLTPTSAAITVTTNQPTAAFTITGPTNLSGNGTSTTFQNEPAGTYTINFGPVAGYATPGPQTQPGGPISFLGTYAYAPSLTVTPPSLQFTYEQGFTGPIQGQTVVVGSTGAAILFTASATSSGNWLSVAPSSGTTGDSSATITADVTLGMPAGTYPGQITIIAPTVNTITVPVTLTVTPMLPSLLVSPTTLTFSYNQGVPRADKPQTVTVSASDGSALAVTAMAITDPVGGGWLSVQPTTASTPASLTVTASPKGLVSGTYTGQIETTAAASNSPKTTFVSLVINPPVPPVEHLVFTGTSSEPSIAVDPHNPNHAVVGFNDLSTTNTVKCGWTESTDGVSWQKSNSLNFPSGFAAMGDPWVRFGSNGELFYSCMAATAFDLNVRTWGVFVAVSPSGLASDLGDAVPVYTAQQTCQTTLICDAWDEGESTDHPSIAVVPHNTNSSGFRLAACWVDVFGSGADVYLYTAYSDDGKTWSAPTTVAGPKVRNCTMGVQGSDLAVTWEDISRSPGRLKAATSSNGVEWTPLSTPIGSVGQTVQGSTTALVVSPPYALVTPNAYVWQANTPPSQVFWNGQPLDGPQAETFLPGTGNCAQLVGAYEITTSPNLFRYKVWFASSLGEQVVFTSGADLNGQDGYRDPRFPFPRIGDYTSTDCKFNIGWAAWTDVRNGTPQIWAVKIPLPE